MQFLLYMGIGLTIVAHDVALKYRKKQETTARTAVQLWMASMATKSILKSVSFDTEEQAVKFLTAIEESMQKTDKTADIEYKLATKEDIKDMFCDYMKR